MNLKFENFKLLFSIVFLTAIILQKVVIFSLVFEIENYSIYQNGVNVVCVIQSYQ